MNKNTKLLTYTALMTAFVFVTTSIVKIPIPFTNGYIHAGDMSIFIGAILLGPFYGAFLGGVGSALADFFGGYAQWVMPTLLVKGTMGFIIGYFAHKQLKLKWSVPALIVLWLGLIVAIFTIVSSTTPATLLTAIEDATTLDDALKLAADFKTQLLITGVLVPAIGLVMAYIARRIKLSTGSVMGIFIGGVWMVFGYYIAGGLMYGSMLASLFSIPWNIVQFLGGGVLAFILMNALTPTGLPERIHAELNRR